MLNKKEREHIELALRVLDGQEDILARMTPGNLTHYRNRVRQGIASTSDLLEDIRDGRLKSK